MCKVNVVWNIQKCDKLKTMSTQLHPWATDLTSTFWVTWLQTQMWFKQRVQTSLKVDWKQYRSGCTSQHYSHKYSLAFTERNSGVAPSAISVTHQDISWSLFFFLQNKGNFVFRLTEVPVSQTVSLFSPVLPPSWLFCPCLAPLLPLHYSNLSSISLSCLLPHYYSLHQTWVTSLVLLEGFVG